MSIYKALHYCTIIIEKEYSEDELKELIKKTALDNAGLRLFLEVEIFNNGVVKILEKYGFEKGTIFLRKHEQNTGWMAFCLQPSIIDSL